jgi:hypothetical protein
MTRSSFLVGEIIYDEAWACQFTAFPTVHWDVLKNKMKP